MKILFVRLFPLLFIFALWIVFASPYLSGRNVPYPSKYQVNHFPPWSYYEKFWGPVKNGAMPDIIDQIYPWRFYSISVFKTGNIPLWNPYSFSGTPHLANFQSAALSPVNVLFFILPFLDAWSIVILLQPLLAGIFTYFILRIYAVSKVGSLLGSVSFMFCGFIVVWMAYGTLAMAILFLPLGIFFVEKYFLTRSYKYIVLLSIVFPLSFFSGHFQASLYFAMYLGAYGAYKLFQTKKITSFFPIGIGLFSGALMTLPQILPSIEFYQNSVRSNIFLKRAGIPIQYLVTVIAPDFFGNPVTRNDWFGQYAEWASFIGIIALTFSLFCIFSKNKIYKFFLIAGVLSVIFSINSPLQEIVSFLKIPVLSTSVPNRIIVLFSFSFAVLAGFGFDSVIRLLEKRNYKKLSIILGILFAILSAIWILLVIGKILPADKNTIATRNLILPTILYGTVVVFVGINIWLKNKKVLFASSVLLLLLAGFDSFRFAQKWMPFDPREYVFPNVPVVAELKKDVEYGRVYGNLGAHVDTYYGIYNIEGYDPLYPQRYGEVLRSASMGKFLEAERSVVKLDRRGRYTDRVLDLLGVSLVLHPRADTNQSWAYPVWMNGKRFAKIYEDDKFEVYRNKDSLPRALFYYDYHVIPDTAAHSTLQALFAPNFDLKNKLILEEDPQFEKTEGKGTATIVSNLPNKIDIDVNTNKTGILFLSDNYYPGWKAFIDGKEIKILRSNYSFKGIVVSAGSHRVQFRYLPQSFYLGVVFFGVGVGILFLASLQTRNKKHAT